MTCPKCKKKMERRRHGKDERSYLRKRYHFSEWDYCEKCHYVQHYERYKVPKAAGGGEDEKLT